MAHRRMVNPKITDTDMFLDLPLSSQALYFHLNTHADDDGFIDNINTIKRMVGASTDDEKLLIAKQFIIQFEDKGIVVIKDWRIHNYIRKDRYTPTIHNDIASRLTVDSNGSYQMKNDSTLDVTGSSQPVVNQLATKGIPVVDAGKDRLGKDRLGKTNTMSSSNEHDVSLSSSTKKLLEKINELSGRKFRLTDSAKRLVKPRLADYSLEELLDMLDYKWNDWADWDGRYKAFQPETLFRAKNTDKYIASMQAKPIKSESDSDDWLAQITEAADNA
ncbi:conserved phage C-terminal domain-containing protein [Weissella minor]|uniref:conserved phage C-terminal domain-containing protein n=1 Tax=Weissella minor TaxID=1620 RepID=UPI001BAE81A6|nr:conserved phage C-terminal domain-containing protein [Weissella minor]MBS0950554.1 conserved phage C-terminal domain-containing protein [Weissella minor]